MTNPDQYVYLYYGLSDDDHLSLERVEYTNPELNTRSNVPTNIVMKVLEEGGATSEETNIQIVVPAIMSEVSDVAIDDVEIFEMIEPPSASQETYSATSTSEESNHDEQEAIPTSNTEVVEMYINMQASGPVLTEVNIEDNDDSTPSLEELEEIFEAVCAGLPLGGPEDYPNCTWYQTGFADEDPHEFLDDYWQLL